MSNDSTPVPDFREIRKIYVQQRVETLLRSPGARHYPGNWRQGAKEEAHREFNAFVQTERDKAAEDARLAGFAAGWDDGWLHRSNNTDPDSPEYGINPYTQLIRQRHTTTP